MGRMERFKQALGANPTLNPPRVRDAVGRVLEPGDEVLILTHKFPMRVAEITPLLEQPGVPPGMMRLRLVARVDVIVPRDATAEDLYFTRHQAEIGDHAIDLSQGQPPPGDEQGEDKADETLA